MLFRSFNPLSNGWSRMLSGVSPCGTCHMISPRSRLIAESVPYGGFVMGIPWMFRGGTDGTGGEPAAGAGGGVFSGLCDRPASAAQQSPGPRTTRNGCPATPETYWISENPGGGATRDFDDIVLPACAKTVCSSGSSADPGQLDRKSVV